MRFYFRAEGTEDDIESLSRSSESLGAIKQRRHAGEALTRNNMVYWQSHEKVASVGEEATRAMGECIEKFALIVATLRSDMALAWSFVVVLSPEERGSGVYLNRESIRGLADLGADVDVDLC